MQMVLHRCGNALPYITEQFATQKMDAANRVRIPAETNEVHLFFRKARIQLFQRLVSLMNASSLSCHDMKRRK